MFNLCEESGWGKRHLKTIESHNIFECKHCMKLIKKYSKTSHMKICTNSISFNCKECSFKTKFKNNLQVHVDLKHQNIKVKDCKPKKEKETKIQHVDFTFDVSGSKYANKKSLSKQFFQH